MCDLDQQSWFLNATHRHVVLIIYAKSDDKWGSYSPDTKSGRHTDWLTDGLTNIHGTAIVTTISSFRKRAQQTRGPWATSLTWVTLALAQQWWFRKEFSSFLKTDPVVLEKNILCKTLIPCCGLALPPGGMIWSNLILLYIRKL